MESIQKKIGIIGGGQLGQMMILEAKKWAFISRFWTQRSTVLPTL